MEKNRKNKRKDEDIVIYSYDPLDEFPHLKSIYGSTKEEIEENYKKDPEFRKIIDEVFGKH